MRLTIRVSIWIWFAYWITQIFVGDLGASPALRLNHQLGNIVLVLLTANLTLGLLLDLFRPAPSWIRFWITERRFWGVSAFLILLFHIGFYLLNEGFEGKAFVQIVTKTYLIFGFLGALVLMILAITSNNLSIRRLGGKRWKRLHRSIYIVQLTLFGHLLLIEKADVLKFSIWLGVLLILQIVRQVVVWRRQK